ncbi:hypothetical protein D9611_000194 [Ephemerocybe angulata]|uniref:RNase H type-1 domain-containing protein n=1 Tax=Ephemerocybe angulata TaxID=980116 RepID=A0A8H5BML6_9AGAR|nr:hypothetical protein D9611_000194 [Tulosesus angulatus]
MLEVQNDDGTTRSVTTNDEKAKMLANSFFIEKPESDAEGDAGREYLEAMKAAIPFDVKRICDHMKRLSPYKAPGVILDRSRTAVEGASYESRRELNEAVGIPKMTYAADVWYIPPEKGQGGKKKVGSVDALERMARVQRIAAIVITGALGLTAGDMLDAHASIEPMEVQLLTIHRPTHARQAYRKHDQKFANPSPIQTMARRYDTDPTKTEKITLKARAPDHHPTFGIRIAQDRETSIADEKEDNTPIRIYTDGSGINKKTGAAALLYRGEATEPTHTMHYYLGKKSHHSTYEAEWVGAILGVWILVSKAGIRQEVGTKKISVYTDNQSMKSGRPGPGQYLQDEFFKLANMLSNNGPNRQKFTMRWISAHSDVAQNEKVDEEAKKAARGETSFIMSLPPLLQPGLPRSIFSLKEEVKKEAKKRWAEIWAGSKRSEGFENIDTEFPFKGYRKHTKELTRAQNSMLVQLRTGHIPLNMYLHIRKKTDTSTCQKCNSGKPETLEHFLHVCPAYRAHRAVMDKVHGRDKRNMVKIMGNYKHIRALVRYANRMGRFTLSRNGAETDRKGAERAKKREEEERRAEEKEVNERGR